VARAYLDQLARASALAPDKLLAARDALARSEQQGGQQRRETLTQLASQLTGDAPGSTDQVKVRKLSAVVLELANAEH